MGWDGMGWDRMGWDRIWDGDGSRCADALSARASPRARRSQPAPAALSARRALRRQREVGWGGNRMGWDRMGWDRMGWDGIGWDGMG